MEESNIEMAQELNIVVASGYSFVHYDCFKHAKELNENIFRAHEH